MNKLALRLDDLQVDTFQTTSAAKQKGNGARRAVHLLHAVHLPRLRNLRRHVPRHLPG
jgi:hypothetical protein